ncbi:HEAT repeat-containing protein 4, partial [Seriola lalandi dorsalis]|uniref:HEAT repeat-containing protein 4 n=1 Tax=Seriola lalandi dorsalis TaxID=1841481 RepID=UPI000C6F7D35
RSQRLYQRFLTDAAAGLTFSPDAGTDPRTDGVLYIQADYNHLFRPTGVLRPAAKSRLYRPAPRLNHRQAPQELPAYGWLPRLLDSSESASHPPPQRRRLLQDSCMGTRVTEVKPVHKVAHKTHIVLNDSKSRHLQRRPPPARKATPTRTNKKSVTTESQDRDQDQDRDQTRRPQVKLEDGRGLQDRVEALKLISSLKLTTAKLLKSLVSCFKDESPAVRKQACVAAASLLLKDETVVSRLLELLENDPAREVRLSAIEAVGALGLSSADVQETLQSYVETEEDAELREAACRLLPVDNLHDFLLLDPECNGLVCRTITETLQEERCNAQLISLQVKRLCEGRIIADKVLLLEKLQNEKHKGRRLQRRVLCRLMSLLYRTDLYETPDDP